MNDVYESKLYDMASKWRRIRPGNLPKYTRNVHTLTAHFAAAIRTAPSGEKESRASACAMGSLIQRVVFSSEKTHTTTYESDGSRLGGWTILNGPAQKTARFHLLKLIKEDIINNIAPLPCRRAPMGHGGVPVADCGGGPARPARCDRSHG